LTSFLRTQLDDASIESYRVYGWGYVLTHPVTEKKANTQVGVKNHQKIVTGNLLATYFEVELNSLPLASTLECTGQTRTLKLK